MKWKHIYNDGIILLGGGNYSGAGNYNINVINKTNLTIRASGVGGVPVIDAEGQGRIFNVNVNSDNITLNGLKMINGNISGYGCGVYINRGGSVVNCSFTNTTSSDYGGGVFIDHGNIGSVVGCSFVGCSARLLVQLILEIVTLQLILIVL